MNGPEMVRRVKAGEDPLELSIESWKERRDTGQSSNVCALCYDQMPKGLCTTCIVRKHTGKMGVEEHLIMTTIKTQLSITPAE